MVADTALGLPRLVCSVVGILRHWGPGLRARAKAILMSNAWAFTRRELATSGQVFAGLASLRRGSQAKGRAAAVVTVRPLERETGEHGRGSWFST